uniref:RING-type domain-containing protein n=1 Tax=Cyanistes caeruleus TaxID=156563 RepID=A0A8C0U147_CYACU
LFLAGPSASPRATSTLLNVLHGPSMATEMGGNCAICQDIWNDMASALPCGHQFCWECILQWAQTNPSCPLCRGANPSRGQSHPSVVPVSPEQDQPQEEAGPSVQSTSPRYSGPTQGRHCSPGPPQRSLKRKTPDPEDSPHPCKRHPHQ